MKAQVPRVHESHNVARPSVDISFPDRRRGNGGRCE